MRIEALPFVNWIFWAALSSGTLLVVGLTEALGGTTRGYRLFMAWMLVVFAVVLVRHAGEFFAVQNNCSHRDFPLSEAGFDPRDGVLVCAWHGGCFDVRTGDAVVPPATEPVETFPVRITDGWVEIGLVGSLQTVGAA